MKLIIPLMKIDDCDLFCFLGSNIYGVELDISILADLVGFIALRGFLSYK